MGVNRPHVAPITHVAPVTAVTPVTACVCDRVCLTGVNCSHWTLQSKTMAWRWAAQSMLLCTGWGELSDHDNILIIVPIVINTSPDCCYE